MPFRQPAVTPPPSALDLNGQTAIVTGASNGIGLEICRQLLQRRVGTLVMAVRNIAKGEELKARLLAEREIKNKNPNVIIKVMQLDTASYTSVQKFTRDYLTQNTRLDVLMLNAGVLASKHEFTKDGHESMVEINYLSNVLLFFGLLPALESTTDATGRASRVSITGSRMYNMAPVAEAQFTSGKRVFDYIDAVAKFNSLKQYANSKLLVALFVREVGDRYASEKVILNNFCPGLVNTSNTNELPMYLRVPINLVKYMRARSVETAGWVALHAACVAKEETHGQFLADKAAYSGDMYLNSEKGDELRKALWDETMEEVRNLTTLPEWA